MASMRLCGVLLFLAIFIVTFSDAAVSRSMRHYVNGREGWVPSPSQGFNQWAGSHRFLVNDTLYFRYNKDQDSVLEVNEQDYNTCNTENPIMKQQNGESEVSLPHDGPFYFISGNKTRCDQGEKMIIKVLSTSHPPPAPTPPPLYSPPTSAPAPKTSPAVGPPPAVGGPTVSASPPSSTTPIVSGPAMSPSSGTPVVSGPAASPVSGTPVVSGPTMSPSSGTPVVSGPAMSPSFGEPVSSPSSSVVSPASQTPAMSPGSMMGPAGALSPTTGLSPSGAPMAMSPSTATSPSAEITPTSSPPMPSGASMAPGASPSGLAADATAPAPETKSGGERVSLTIVTMAMGVLSISFALISLF